MKIQILLTGNELMSGHTVDSNSATVANKLAEAGFSLDRKVTVGDDFELLVRELKQLSADSDVLIVNGGLGPTIDDLTAQALGKTTDKKLVENQDALAHLTHWCKKRKASLNQANLKQTLLPEGVEIIPNPVGSAVGFYIDYQNCLIICTPGVPSELKVMLDQTILTLLTTRFPDHDPGAIIRFQTFGLGESALQQIVDNDYPDWPEEVDLGFRAGLPLLEVKLTINNSQHQSIQQQCYQKVNQLIGDYIIGEQSTTLHEAVVKLLQPRGEKITTAESCTGGQIASALTQVPGASTVFEAGFVTYSNTMKQQQLGVDAATLTEHGAVSEEVVKQMANGALQKSQADYAIAVSGIAGPDGGTSDKPVGTVWIAWGSASNLHTQRLQLNTSRHWFQTIVTATALDLIRRELMSIEAEPGYFKRYR